MSADGGKEGKAIKSDQRYGLFGSSLSWKKHKKNVTFSISSLSQRSVEGESSVHLDIHLT